jgi:hypothetical protein
MRALCRAHANYMRSRRFASALELQIAFAATGFCVHNLSRL